MRILLASSDHLLAVCVLSCISGNLLANLAITWTRWSERYLIIDVSTRSALISLGLRGQVASLNKILQRQALSLIRGGRRVLDGLELRRLAVCGSVLVWICRWGTGRL